MNSSARGRRTRGVVGLAVVCGVVAGSIGGPAAASAVPTFSGGGGAYTEQAAPARVSENLAITGGTSYAGQYVDFSITGAASTEALSMMTAATPAAATGEVSIVGSTVYLGNGSSAEPIGSVDSVRNGQNGQPLRVNFTSAFVNPGFETGTATGWTAIESRIDLGVTPINGVIPTDTSTYPSNVPNLDNNQPSRAGTNRVSVQSSIRSDGTHAMELSLTGVTTARGCDVVHGPAVYSAPFAAAAGDKIYFDWRAYQGADNYHVFGYIVDGNGVQTEVLDATGGGNTDWTTKETTIPSAGEYRFVFVAGTHDATCGLAAGAKLYIDNVRVFGTKATGPVVQDIARLLQYANSSDNPPAERTVVVTAASNDAGTGTGQFTIAITPVDDAPALATPPTAIYTNQFGNQDYTSTTGQFAVTDPDDTAFTYGVVGAVSDALTIAGVPYTHRVDGRYGSLRYNDATGFYSFDPVDSTIDARRSNDSETFSVSATSNGLSGAATFTVEVSVPASVPGAPIAIDAEGGTQKVRVSWAPNDWTGGSSTTAYVVESSVDGNSWAEAARTPDARTWMDVTGLVGGTTYQFRVMAINSTGTSAPSPAASAMALSAPTPPRDVALTNGDGSVSVSWAAPVSEGGRSVLGYRVDVSRDGGATWQVGAQSTGPGERSVRIADLENGVPVTVRVVARNMIGDSAPSGNATETPRTTASAPLPGGIVHGDRSVRLEWDAPVSDGGAAISGYRVERLMNGTWVTAADLNAASREIVIGGLTNGSPVTYRVRALNSEGAGAVYQYESATPRTTASAPGISRIDGAGHRLLLSIDSPSDTGGAAISGYEASTDGGVTWVPTAPAGERWAVWGLENNVAYDVMVRALNSEGAGAMSETVRGTPVLAPMFDESGLLPALPTVAPGSARLVLNGTVRDIAKDATATEIVYDYNGLQVSLATVARDGAVFMLDGRGRLVVTGDGQVLVSGSGFMPDSMADVWLFSDPVMLGEVEVDGAGEFRAVLPLPKGVVIGDHTVQLNGTSAQGETATLELGLTISSPHRPAALHPPAAQHQAPMLPRTGVDSDAAGTMALGAMLLVFGGLWLRVRGGGVTRGVRA